MKLFYDRAVDLGCISQSPADSLPRVKPAKPSPRPAPESIVNVALRRARPREQLMIRLAAELGLRRCEVASVHAEDMTQDALGWSLIVHGKGQRNRRLPVPSGLAAQILANAQGGYLFPGGDDGHLSPRWVGKLLSRLLPGNWTMHPLRHRFATRAYHLDSDLLAVQQLLGHESPATTRVYVQLPDDRLRSTVERLAAPTAAESRDNHHEQDATEPPENH